jgi:hypothetical protein
VLHEHGWCVNADDGWKLLGGAVCKNTWEAVSKEKPTETSGSDQEGAGGNPHALDFPSVRCVEPSCPNDRLIERIKKRLG